MNTNKHNTDSRSCLVIEIEISSCYLKTYYHYFVSILLFTSFPVFSTGIIRDCVVEMIQQSPFMPLTTALFEAVADLNHHNIFPNKDTLHEYLRKHYPEIKTPDTRIIHDCLGRLIKNRRLYHNGRGYFILFSENILNDVISLKTAAKTRPPEQQYPHLDATSLEPSIIGFNLVDSRTSSSGQTDAHTTDLPTDYPDNHRTSAGNQHVFKRHNSYDTLTEVTALADGVANISELYTPKLPRSSFGSKLFRGKINNNNSNNSKSPSTPTTPNESVKISKSKFFCGTATDSIILSNNMMDLPSRIVTTTAMPMTIANKDVLDSAAMSDTTDIQSSSAKTGRRRKVKRSKTFTGNKTKNLKEVSFALIGSPKDENSKKSDSSGDENVENHHQKRFQRSHSFGVGYRKDKYQRPLVLGQGQRPSSTSRGGFRSTVNSEWRNLHRTKTISFNSSNDNNTTTVERRSSNFDTEEDTTYDDIETSFVDDSLPVFDQDPNHDREDVGCMDWNQNPATSASHMPDMRPVVEPGSVDMLEKYKDLGSALSLPRANDKGVNLDVLNLLSPTREECLAEELKQANSSSVRTRSPATDEANPRKVSLDSTASSSRLTGLTSPRSRRKHGTPYESQYLTDVLDQSQQICQALEASKNDGSNDINSGVVRKSGKSKDTNNNNKSKTKEPSSVTSTTTVKGVKMRNRAKSSEEERKRNQKERNSLLFEEKRASLKVMGLV